MLATLETVFQPLLPQLNLRQWTGSIYDWLTQSALDPTNSGRVTMDNLMKLVLAALEWSYEAKATDVQEKWLEQAAELLVLRQDTFQIIDGKGPEAGTEQASETEKEAASEIPAQQVSSPNEEQAPPSSAPVEQVKQAQSREREESQHTWPEDGRHILAVTTGGPLRLSEHAERVYNTGQNVTQRGICAAQGQPSSERPNA